MYLRTGIVESAAPFPLSHIQIPSTTESPAQFIGGEQVRWLELPSSEHRIPSCFQFSQLPLAQVVEQKPCSQGHVTEIGNRHATWQIKLNGRIFFVETSRYELSKTYPLALLAMSSSLFPFTRKNFSVTSGRYGCSTST